MQNYYIVGFLMLQQKCSYFSLFLFQNFEMETDTTHKDKDKDNISDSGLDSPANCDDNKKSPQSNS